MQVFTSDHALKLDWIPKWIAIIGSGYIGLEFSDVYTALGSEVTFIEVASHCFWHCMTCQECLTGCGIRTVACQCVCNACNGLHCSNANMHFQAQSCVRY